MEAFFTRLIDPFWWVSVVAVGIIINMISAYLKNQIDKSLSTTTAWWQRRSAKRKILWDTYLQNLQSSREARNNARHQETRARQRAVFFLVFSLFFAMFGMFMHPDQSSVSWNVMNITFGISCLLMLFSALCIGDAARIARAIYAAGISE